MKPQHGFLCFFETVCFLYQADGFAASPEVGTGRLHWDQHKVRRSNGGTGHLVIPRCAIDDNVVIIGRHLRKVAVQHRPCESNHLEGGGEERTAAQS